MPRISIGTISEVIILPIVNIPPAPKPHNALARMKLVMLCAKAHHSVPTRKNVIPKIYGGLRPMVSDSRPYSGWKDVEVRRKAVDSQDALFEE